MWKVRKRRGKFGGRIYSVVGHGGGEAGSGTGRCNVVARVKIGSGGKTVVLNSHMDVVPAADGWDTAPYQLTIMDEELTAGVRQTRKDV